MLTRRIPCLVAVLGLSSLCATMAHAQTSLGDAARKVREENKGRQPSKVINNDDISEIKGTVSIVGTVPQPPSEVAPAAAPGAPAPPVPEVKDEAYWRKQFAAARKQLAADNKELDILQREYNLKEQQFYQNPNVALREQYGRADLNKTRDDINTKKADVEKDQQAITTLEDDLRKSGGDAGWGRAQ
jgi:hypothetical protein